MSNKLKTVRNHIEDIDKNCGSYLKKLYTNNLKYILDAYYQTPGGNVFERKAAFTTKYNNRVTKLIKNKTIDFEHYCILIRNIVDTLLADDLKQSKLKLHYGFKIEHPNVKKLYYLFTDLKSSIRFQFLIKPNKINSNGLQLKYFFSFEDIMLSESNSLLAYVFKKLTNPISILKFIISKIAFSIYLFLISIIVVRNYHNLMNLFKSLYGYYLNKFSLMIISLDKSELTVSILKLFINNSLQNPIYIFLFIVMGFIGLYICSIFSLQLIKYIDFQIRQLIYKKYSNFKKYEDYYSDNEVPLFDGTEKALESAHEDLLGFNILAARIYYQSIFKQFDPDINKIFILNAKKGMGKSTLLNFLKNQISHITYRGTNHWQQFKDIIFKEDIKIVKLSLYKFVLTLPFDKSPELDENNISEKIQLNDIHQNVIKKLLYYLANNLDSNLAKLIKSVFKSIDSVTYKGLIFKIINTLEQNDILEIKENNIRKSEQKTLILIEDLDRLTDYQLRVIAPFFDLIQNLPFTITILASEKDSIIKALNESSILNNSYSERLTYKFIQFDIETKNLIYEPLAASIINQVGYFNNLRFFPIHSAFLRLSNNYINKRISISKLFRAVRANDWETQLLKSLFRAYNNISNLINKNTNNSYENLLKSNLLTKYEKRIVQSIGNRHSLEDSKVNRNPRLELNTDNINKYFSLPNFLSIMHSHTVSFPINKFQDIIISDIKAIFIKYEVSIYNEAIN